MFTGNNGDATRKSLAPALGESMNSEPAADESPTLLVEFHGKGALPAWLATVATHRLIHLKRKQQRRSQCAASGGDWATRSDRPSLRACSIHS